jgi:uncharacterized protein YcbK (DUF882 family)
LKLPPDSQIDREKLVKYLLLPRKENDKSKFLKEGGYTLRNWEKLRDDLREALKEEEAQKIDENDYGEVFELRTTLEGPSGVSLHVVTVWITLKTSGETRFVTLYPE